MSRRYAFTEEQWIRLEAVILGRKGQLLVRRRCPITLS